MSLPPGRPKEGSLPLGGKARSAKGAPISALYSISALEDFARALLEAAGLPRSAATIVAAHLREAELLGRHTHGFVLLDWYLADLQSGAMNKEGEPLQIADTGSALVWDGRWLPGSLLVNRAIDTAFDRSSQYPVVTVCIRQSHHLGCHAVYLRRAVERKLMILLMDTNPGFRVVAPFGSAQPAYSPTPISVGIPTKGEPIVIDFSLSSCSNSRATLAYRRQEKLAGKWLIDAAGTLTDDPAVLFADPPGSILPLGGADLGYKGFSLALMVYALSAGLAGHRTDDTSRGNYSAVFLQIINPDLFSGSDIFQDVMSTFVDACRQCTGPTNTKGVHIPGDAAEGSRAAALNSGVSLTPECLQILTKWSPALGIPMPDLHRPRT